MGPRVLVVGTPVSPGHGGVMIREVKPSLLCCVWKVTAVILSSQMFVSSLGIAVKAKEAKKLRGLLRPPSYNYHSLSLYLFSSLIDTCCLTCVG